MHLPRRSAVLLLAAALPCSLLTGCGGSSLPSVSLSSGTSSVKSQAVSWLVGSTLKQASPALRELGVRPGTQVRVAVAGAVASRGWQVRLDDKVVVNRTSTQSASFAVPRDLGSRQPLVTVLAAPVGSSTHASGLWIFRLVPGG